MTTPRYRPSLRRRVWLTTLGLAACTPVSQGYIVHSADLTCDEANRVVYAAIGDMSMKVTAFTPAAPGRPGRLTAVGRDRRGDVSIVCDAQGVHIDPNQATMGDKSFERGIFLSVTGRSGLTVERTTTGESAVAPDGSGQPGSAPASASGGMRMGVRKASTTAQAAEPPAGGVSVTLEPQRGFSTVLDFDADLATAGILPIKVNVHNATARSYTFDPADIVVRVRGARTSAEPLSATDATTKLNSAAGSGKQTNIGNVASATKIMTDKALKGGKLAPGASTSGYVYYPVGDYDRAKVTMTDVETGELEGFSVEF